MAPIDERDTALIDTAASVVGALIIAHAYADHPGISQQVMRLLNAVAKYNAAMTERPSDAALVRAVATMRNI